MQTSDKNCHFDAGTEKESFKFLLPSGRLASIAGAHILSLEVTSVELRRFVDSKSRKGLVNSQLHPDILY